MCFFFFSSRRRHTRSDRDWSSDVCSSDLRDQRLAGDLGREGIGGRRGHAEEGRVAQELAAVDLALDELALERGQKGVFVSGSHGQVLPGQIVSAVIVSLSTLSRRNRDW